MLLFILKALVRLIRACRVLEEYDNYSKYFPPHIHKVFPRTERNVFLSCSQKFDSTKFTEIPRCRKNYVKCWRGKWKKPSCPEKTHDPERGGELLASQVENQTRNNCRPGLIHTWEHGVELPFWEATDCQISLNLGASMPVTFRLGLFEMTICLLLKCMSHLSPSAVTLASCGT